MTIKSKLYLFALVIISLLFIKQSLTSQLSDKLEVFAKILNFSGRQRMISQNIAKNAVKLKEAESKGQPFFEGRRKLKEMAESFKKVHYGLYERDNNLNFGGENSQDVERMFKDIEHFFNVIYDNALNLVNNQQVEDIVIYTRVIDNNNEAFLTRMNGIVDQYEYDFKEETKSLSNTIFMLNAVIIIIFFLGMFYIIQEVN